MSQGLNSVRIIGHLGKDPELREGNGQSVCKFSVAVGERKKDGDQWVDATEWFSVVCFGKTADNASQYLAKGRQVFVDGRLSTRQYEKDGQTRYFTEVVANTVLFLGGGEKPTAAAKANAASAPATSGAGSGFDSDLPFNRCRDLEW